MSVIRFSIKEKRETAGGFSVRIGLLESTRSCLESNDLPVVLNALKRGGYVVTEVAEERRGFPYSFPIVFE